MHLCHITDKDTVKHTAPNVAQRVPILPGCIAHVVNAVFKVEPVNDNDKEN
jgi:hypothetical protein